MSRYPVYSEPQLPSRPSDYSNYRQDSNPSYQNQYPPANSTDAFNSGTAYSQPHSLAPQFNNTQAMYSPIDSTNNNNFNSPSGTYPFGEKPTPARSNKKKWLIIGGVVGLVAIIAIGVGVGVAVSNKKGGSSSGGKTNTTKGYVGSVNNVVMYNPDDPSQFDKDPRLTKSLYGMAYMPEGAIMPACGATMDAVLEDVMLMSQLTTRIRVYGSDCNQTAMVMEAIKMTKTDLTVYFGIFINDDDTVYTRQRDEIKRIIQLYGTDHISGVTVGNEYVLNYLTSKSSDDPTDANGLVAAAFLQAKIKDTRDMLASLNLDKTIPVGNGDAGSYTNTQILGSVDYFMSNIHPWFGHLPVDQSATWTWEFFQQNNVAMAATLPNNPELFIAETGWPTKSSDAEHATNGASAASVADLQIFIDSWICQANNNGTKYFWFENMDQPWKDAQFGGVEGWWGLFDDKKQLKNVTLPDCLAP